VIIDVNKLTALTKLVDRMCYKLWDVFTGPNIYFLQLHL